MAEKCLGGKILGRNVPRKHTEIILYVEVPPKGRRKAQRLPVCRRCWEKIAKSDWDWP